MHSLADKGQESLNQCFTHISHQLAYLVQSMLDYEPCKRKLQLKIWLKTPEIALYKNEVIYPLFYWQV